MCVVLDRNGSLDESCMVGSILDAPLPSARSSSAVSAGLGKNEVTYMDSVSLCIVAVVNFGGRGGVRHG